MTSCRRLCRINFLNSSWLDYLYNILYNKRLLLEISRIDIVFCLSRNKDKLTVDFFRGGSVGFTVTPVLY